MSRPVSEPVSEPGAGRVRPRRFQVVQPAAVLWLTVVWVGLWGDLSFANVLSGALLGVLVSVVFPLPPVRMRLRVRPAWAVWLVVRFLWDVAIASVQVSWVILVRRDVRNSVIEVDLRSPSDFVLTVVAEMTSLVPGSLVVEAHRSSHTLFLHVLDTADRTAAEQMRERTLALEHRVVMATGADRVQGEEARESS